VATILVLNMKSKKTKLIIIGSIYGIAIVANVICLGLLGWVY